MEIEPEPNYPAVESKNEVPQSEVDGNRPEAGSLSATPKTVFLSGSRLLILMASTTLAGFLVLLDASIIATAIPRITSDFHTVLDIGWYGSAYQIANASLQPLTGKLYRYFNSKWTFLIFFAIFEFGSLICGISSSSKMLVVGRAVAGMGASGIQNGTFTMVGGCVPKARRPSLLGIGLAVAQFGLALGPLVGGALTEYTTWRWCFYINIPLGIVVAMSLIYISVPENIDKPSYKEVLMSLHRKLDLVGFALFAPAAIQCLLALQYGGQRYAWSDSVVIGLFCGSAATLLLFLVWEYHKGTEAMMPFYLLRMHTLWCSCLVMLFLVSTTFCATYYLPVYFQAIRGASPLRSGVNMLPSILCQLISAGVSGPIVGRIGYYLPFSILGGILVTVGSGLLSMLSPTTPTSAWVGYQVLLGSGRGMGMPMPIIAVQNALEPTQFSIAQSLLLFGHTFGGAVFLSMANTIFTNSLRSEILKYAPSVNPNMVITAGATAFRGVIERSELAGVIMAYSKSVDRVFYLTAVGGCCCFCFAWGMGWKDVRKMKDEETPKQEAV